MKDLAGAKVGTSLHTMQEYTLDMLLDRAGVPRKAVTKEAVEKIPMRAELLANGKLDAAILPEPWLTFAISRGDKLLSDDTTGENISVTLVLARKEWLATAEGAKAMRLMQGALDHAAKAINEDPAQFRALLSQRGDLPKTIAGTYMVDTFPRQQLPAEDVLARQQAWLVETGQLQKPIPYNVLVWKP